MSGKSYLLDTNIIVGYFNGQSDLVQKINTLPAVVVPYVVIGELYYGAFKSSRQQQNIQRIRSFLSLCTVLPADEETSYWYGSIRDALRQKGKPIPENDIWVAALAQQYQHTLASRDAHFREVDNLDVEVW